MSQNDSLNLVGVKVSDLTRLYFERIDRRPYIICPELIADNRVVSIRSGAAGVRPIFEATLRRMGYSMVSDAGVVSICPLSEVAAAPAPVEASTIQAEKKTQERERVVGEIDMDRQGPSSVDELTALAGCGSYVASGASPDDPQGFCYREQRRRLDARLARLHALEAARVPVEGRAR